MFVLRLLLLVLVFLAARYVHVQVMLESATTHTTPLPAHLCPWTGDAGRLSACQQSLGHAWRMLLHAVEHHVCLCVDHLEVWR